MHYTDHDALLVDSLERLVLQIDCSVSETGSVAVFR
jgi:hypothetical protein